MKTLSVPLSKLAVLLLLAGCSGRSGVIEIKKNKIGGLYEINPMGKFYSSHNNAESYQLDTSTFISFADFTNFQHEESEYSDGYALHFKLNADGAMKLKDLTTRNMEKPMCFVIKNKVIFAPAVKSTISNGLLSITVDDKRTLEEIVEYLGK